MTEQEQIAVINTEQFLTDLIAKMQDTLVTLQSKQLFVDHILFFVSGVSCTLWMPKGAWITRLSIGVQEDTTTAIIDLPQVPVGWVTPTVP